MHLAHIVLYVSVALAGRLGHPDPQCKLVVFANGGKMGSTALAMLLTHHFDKKEVCAASYFEFSDARHACRLGLGLGYPYLVDGCSRPMTTPRLQAIRRADPTAVVIVFYRPQASALLSYYNDLPAMAGADKWVRRNWYKPTLDAYAVYRRVLEVFPPQQVVLVETDMMRTYESARDILARISQARGLPPFRRNAMRPPPAPRGGAVMSEATRQWVQNQWRYENQKLCLISKQCSLQLREQLGMRLD